MVLTRGELNEDVGSRSAARVCADKCLQGLRVVLAVIRYYAPYTLDVRGTDDCANVCICREGLLAAFESSLCKPFVSKTGAYKHVKRVRVQSGRPGRAGRRLAEVRSIWAYEVEKRKLERVTNERSVVYVPMLGTS